MEDFVQSLMDMNLHLLIFSLKPEAMEIFSIVFIATETWFSSLRKSGIVRQLRYNKLSTQYIDAVYFTWFNMIRQKLGYQ